MLSTKRTNQKLIGKHPKLKKAGSPRGKLGRNQLMKEPKNKHPKKHLREMGTHHLKQTKITLTMLPIRQLKSVKTLSNQV
jgi:hypothetical protein